MFECASSSWLYLATWLPKSKVGKRYVDATSTRDQLGNQHHQLQLAVTGSWKTIIPCREIRGTYPWQEPKQQRLFPPVPSIFRGSRLIPQTLDEANLLKFSSGCLMVQWLHGKSSQLWWTGRGGSNKTGCHGNLFSTKEIFGLNKNCVFWMNAGIGSLLIP